MTAGINDNGLTPCIRCGHPYWWHFTDLDAGKRACCGESVTTGCTCTGFEEN